MRIHSGRKAILDISIEVDDPIGIAPYISSSVSSDLVELSQHLTVLFGEEPIDHDIRT